MNVALFFIPDGILWYSVVMVKKVAISLPEDILERVERERQRRGESRSTFFRRAAEALLAREAEQHALRRYIRGYRDHPEDAGEVAQAQRLTESAWSEAPWE